MKMLGFALAAVTVLTLAPATALAKREGKVDSILFTCNMDFRATGKSIYIGLGWSSIRGKGTISCYDLVHGTTEILPIKVRAKGPGAGLGVTGLVISGAAGGIGVQRGPSDLIGKYIAVRGNVAVGVGAGAAVGLRVSKGGISIPVSVQAQSGLGAGVDLLSLKIEADGDSRIVETPAPVVAARPVPQAIASGPTVAPTMITADASANAAATVDGDDDDDDIDLQAQAQAQAQVNANNAAASAAARAVVENTPVVESAPVQVTAKSNVVYLQEGQPLQILDAKGRVIQTIYLKQK